MEGSEVIPWGCPVISFGDPSCSKIATLGINPSNREFVDELGNELRGSNRRFHTLSSLGLSSWSGADARHLALVLEACLAYFTSNPYNIWFKRLDGLLSRANVSYYDNPAAACHFDLIPFATESKWSDLTTRQQSALLNVAADALGTTIRESQVRVLILNGRAVVKGFEHLSGVRLKYERMENWTLTRKSSRDVPGISFKGTVEVVAGVHLGRSVQVIGYNHNLQGSFGVSAEVFHAIAGWIAQVVRRELW